MLLPVCSVAIPSHTPKIFQHCTHSSCKHTLRCTTVRGYCCISAISNLSINSLRGTVQDCSNQALFFVMHSYLKTQNGIFALCLTEKCVDIPFWRHHILLIVLFFMPSHKCKGTLPVYNPILSQSLALLDVLFLLSLRLLLLLEYWWPK